MWQAKPNTKSTPLFWLVCFMLTGIGGVHADRAQTARAAIQAQYDRMAVALRNKHLEAYFDICAPDFQQKTPNAVFDRTRMHDQLIQLLVVAEHYRQKTHIVKISLTGNEAHAVAAETCDFDLTLADDTSKHYHQLVQNKDTWVCKNKRWLLKYSQTLP
jgi:hypothetical protein